MRGRRKTQKKVVVCSLFVCLLLLWSSKTKKGISYVGLFCCFGGRLAPRVDDLVMMHREYINQQNSRLLWSGASQSDRFSFDLGRPRSMPTARVMVKRRTFGMLNARRRCTSKLVEARAEN